MSEICQREGRKYIAAVFATHLKEKDPSLGEFKNNLRENDGFVRSEWIEKQKGGNAKFPTKNLVEHIKIWEDLFENFHEESTDGLLRCENVTKTLIDKISNLYPDYPRQLVHKFVFAKTMQRQSYISQVL